jgi:hypothetical protein
MKNRNRHPGPIGILEGLSKLGSVDLICDLDLCCCNVAEFSASVGVVGLSSSFFPILECSSILGSDRRCCSM